MAQAEAGPRRCLSKAPGAGVVCMTEPLCAGTLPIQR